MRRLRRGRGLSKAAVVDRSAVFAGLDVLEFVLSQRGLYLAILVGHDFHGARVLLLLLLLLVHFRPAVVLEPQNANDGERDAQQRDDHADQDPEEGRELERHRRLHLQLGHLQGEALESHPLAFAFDIRGENGDFEATTRVKARYLKDGRVLRGHVRHRDRGRLGDLHVKALFEAAVETGEAFDLQRFGCLIYYRTIRRRFRGA